MDIVSARRLFDDVDLIEITLADGATLQVVPSLAGSAGADALGAWIAAGGVVMPVAIPKPPARPVGAVVALPS